MNKKTIIAPESKKNKLTEISPESSDKKDIETPQHRRALQKYELKHQFLHPLERIIQDKTFVMKVKFPGADEAYPDVTQALFRFVDKYYPYALGGPLYVDEPKNEKEVYRAYERHKVMKKLKLRHLVVEKDSTYEHLLEQMEEFL